MANSLGTELEGKVLEINETHLLPWVRGPENLKRRLVRATGGFGCSPNTNGRAVFVKWLIDGDAGRLDGYDFVRIVPEDEAAQVLGLAAPDDPDEPDFSQPLQPTYVVRWEMSFGPDEGVTTPELAARNALHIMRDPASIATSFDVFIEGEEEPVLTEFDASPCQPCVDGEHADDGTGTPCPCCGSPVS